MAITGVLAGYDEQNLSNQQQAGNQQSLQMNAMTIAAQQKQQEQTQLEQEALKKAAAYANTPDTTDNGATPAAPGSAQTYAMGQGPKTPGGIAYVGPDTPGSGTETPGDGSTVVPASAKPNTSQAEYNEKRAQSLAQQGFPNLANAAWNQASDARQNAMKLADSSNAQMSGNLKNLQMQTDLIGQHMQGVHDQDSYDAAINQMAAEGMPQQEIQLLKNKPYDPEYVQGLMNHAVTLNQAATMRLNSLKLDATNNFHNQEIQSRLTVEQMREAAAAARQKAQENNAKQGAIAAPTSADLDVASSAAKNAMYPDGNVPPDDKPMLNQVTESVASRAKALVKQNKGMDMATASAQAVQELRDSGQLTQAKTTTKGLFSDDTSTSTTFKTKGITPKEPLPDPGDASKRVIGRYYQTPNGVRQWLGTSGQ